MRPLMSAMISVQTLFARAERCGSHQRSSDGSMLPGQMRRTKSRRVMKSKRSGQALLLAVLLMVFAALLASTFVTVVALNLNQTARQEDQSSARQAATAGLNLINQNLTNSPAGTKWRPEMLTPPPAPGAPDYNFYYTAIDRAQGWARTVDKASTGDERGGQWDRDNNAAGTVSDDWAKLEYYRNNPNDTTLQPNRFSGYVKFPDPRTATLTATTPTFLAEVRFLNSTNSSDSTKYGNLQVSVIGLSENNEAVFDRRVAYKGGYAQNPLTAAARSVTNWDFVNNVVPVGQAAAAVVGANTLQLSNVKGKFPLGSFYIGVGNSNAAPQVLAVSNVTQVGSTATLTLAANLTALVAAGTRVELAAALGAQPAIDYNNDTAPDPVTERVDFRVSRSYDNTQPALTNRPASIWVNGVLGLRGNLSLPNLSNPGNGANPTGFIRVSSLIANFGATTDVRRALYRNDDNSTGEITAGSINDSSNNQLLNVTTTTGTAPTTKSLDQLVSDGRNRLQGNESATDRQTAPFTPPAIQAQTQDIGRYRQMSQFSPPYAVAPNPLTLADTSALYGYGRGIYIDNATDRERISVGAYNNREMTQTELLNLWFGSSTTINYARLGTPVRPDSNVASLEQQHLRGWIGPDEFRPRGAIIEIDPRNQTVTITRDSVADNTDLNADSIPDSATTTTVAGADELKNEGPVFNKGWKDANGDLLGGTNGGVYRRTFPWPANGMIFAEGNALVKGGAFDSAGNVDSTVIPPCSLTIVSMNNIYIQGSLNAGARKIVLLAKRNSIVNPTAIVSRVEGQTRLRNDATSTTINVWDSSLFRVGDWVRLGRNPVPPTPETAADQPRRIVNIIPANDQLELSDVLPTTATAGRVVQAVTDPKFGTDYTDRVPYNNYAVRAELGSHVLQRRFNLPPGTIQTRLALRHNAERKDAIRFQGNSGQLPGTTASSIDFANKLLPTFPPTASVLRTNSDPVLNNKLLNIEYQEVGGGSPGTDRYPNPPPNTTADVADTTAPQNLSFIETQMEIAPTGRPSSSNNWSYDVEVQPGYAAAMGYQQPLFHFLASVGNRFDNRTDSLFPRPANLNQPYRRSIFNIEPPPPPPLRSFTLPMGTSVALQMNGNNSTITNDYVSPTETVNQFGFNPLYGDTVNPADPATWEDLLTIDHNFYRNHPTALPTTFDYDNSEYTLDSRRLSIGSPPPSDGINTLALRLNMDATVATGPPGSQVVDYFLAANPIPYYRLSRLKLENLSLNTTDNDMDTIGPATTLRINAFVYAQEGSWFVIPGGVFDDKVKTNSAGVRFVDYNDDNTATPNESVDLNHDGVTSRAEEAAILRFRRYNYALDFTGTIMENRSALIEDPDGTGPVLGCVADWTDKWATVNVNLTGATTFNPATLSTAGGNYSIMGYNFDADASRGFVDTDNDGTLDAGEIDLTADLGFHPPVMPDYEYSG